MILKNCPDPKDMNVNDTAIFKGKTMASIRYDISTAQTQANIGVTNAASAQGQANKYMRIAEAAIPSSSKVLLLPYGPLTKIISKIKF